MKLAEVHQADFGTARLPEAEAEDSVQKEGQDFPLVIATMPATKRQRAIAVGIVILLIVAAAVIAPFASMQVAQVDAFIPVLQTVVSVFDLVTATLLFAQFSIQPQRALLALASGYIFSGSFAFLQTLAFPGAYAPAGLVGDGPNSPAWIYVLWHTTFPAAILAYALSKDATGAARLPGRPAMTTIVITVACVLAVIAGLTWIVTAKTEYLPVLFPTDVRVQARLGNQINLALWLWGATALAVLLFRRRTILDLWLMVTLLAYMPSFLVAIIGSSIRFTIGWYAARGFILVGSCMLLSVLLVETTFLYSRLASAITLQRRERTNRLLSVDAITAAIAHELRTPLGAISLNANTALSQLRSNPPELEEMDEILTDIEAESHRAAAIISSVRQLSKTTPDRSAPTRVEDVARQVLRLLQHDLQVNEVSVATEFQDNLPEVHLDSTQLQQVLLNLVKNAIDAMSSVAPDARHVRLTTSFDGHSTVLLSVQDSGRGIPVEDRERMFDPFFTTKSGGMGMGLAICSTVVENHGGKLRLVKSDSDGSIFELAIPVGGQRSAE
ncbi:MASE4 domain-containing protein [Bradyrhizobium erythrophlei]|uniref:histidine kinase n=1 Tax=Bradyrhizobium erythrophlei TaxID=1437360 RepID=A0A1M5QKN9_9BRAD|nr:MASE4 domain-containing protein [Bradyrhizobium erythrophlei]SHH14401.1 His Kinase A (phospho-acceptor) domain-containing protein [Bradyrhizobium erythrophlei]